MSRTFISRVDSLCDEQAAGLWLGGVRVSDGQLVRCEAKGAVTHLAPLRPVRADPAEHGLLLSVVDRSGHWEGREVLEKGGGRLWIGFQEADGSSPEPMQEAQGGRRQGAVPL